jgi:hypothetical protein
MACSRVKFAFFTYIWYIFFISAGLTVTKILCQNNREKEVGNFGVEKCSRRDICIPIKLPCTTEELL